MRLPVNTLHMLAKDNWILLMIIKGQRYKLSGCKHFTMWDLVMIYADRGEDLCLFLYLFKWIFYICKVVNLLLGNFKHQGTLIRNSNLIYTVVNIKDKYGTFYCSKMFSHIPLIYSLVWFFKGNNLQVQYFFRDPL